VGFNCECDAEVLREHQRALNSAMREIDRERVALQNQEKKTIIEVKNLAKKGQLVCYSSLSSFIIIHHFCCGIPGSSQDHGQGPGEDKAIRAKGMLLHIIITSHCHHFSSSLFLSPLAVL